MKKRKKFLWLLPYFPYPLMSGGNVRVFNLIKNLSRYYDIHLISYYDGEIKNEYIEVLKEYCIEVKVVKRILYEKGELPLIFHYYYTPEMIETIEEAIKDDYDFIQIDFLTMAYYVNMIKEKTDVPVFFTEHDVSTFYFEKCFHNRHLPENERFIEWKRIQETIKNIYPLFNAVFTVSYHDAEVLEDRFPKIRIYPVPTGTDCSYFNFVPERSSKDLVFVGHYLHYPNVDAVNYFLMDVFPLIKEKYPDVKFNIIGSGGTNAFKDISDNKIIITGTVDDLRPFLADSGVFVAPIRIGIGIRGKILEAMATGLPVISSRIGAEGIKAENEDTLLIADSAEEYLEQYKKLMDNNRLRNEIVLNARKYVENNYDWHIMIDKMVAAIEEFFLE